jgi:membrane protease YdiL (CAAX protease family)
MIALPLSGRAARVTALVLMAALARAALWPLGDGLSTAVFGLGLLGIAWSERDRLVVPGRWGSVASAAAGLALGAVLLAPVLGGPTSARPLTTFWAWAAIAAVIATLEEVAIRGALHQRWTEEAGPALAILVGAAVFAAIHLPRYGVAAMPLDFAVGLALGGLRAITGRVMPGAIAHTMADWGAWLWA